MTNQQALWLGLAILAVVAAIVALTPQLRAMFREDDADESSE